MAGLHHNDWFPFGILLPYDPDKCLCDHIGDSLKQKIVKVVRNSLTLTPTDKELIIASLSA